VPDFNDTRMKLTDPILLPEVRGLLRVFLARRARVARKPVSTPMTFKASDCGQLGRQAAGHPWSALRVVKSCRKDCPTAEVLLEAKAAALHPKRYQSSLSTLSTKEGG
jgi:hypothetical protein